LKISIFCPHLRGDIPTSLSEPGGGYSYHFQKAIFQTALPNRRFIGTGMMAAEQRCVIFLASGRLSHEANVLGNLRVAWLPAGMTWADRLSFGLGSEETNGAGIMNLDGVAKMHSDAHGDTDTMVKSANRSASAHRTGAVGTPIRAASSGSKAGAIRQ